MSPYITDIKIINEIFYIFVFLLSLACIFAFSVSQVGPGPIQVRCGHVGPAAAQPHSATLPGGQQGQHQQDSLQHSF